MSDTIGDVGDFEKPPRHPDDIKTEREKLASAMMEILFESDSFSNYGEKFPQEFAYQMGEAVVFLAAPGRSVRAQLLQGYDDAVEDIMAEQQEE